MCPLFPCRVTGVAAGCSRHEAGESKLHDHLMLIRCEYYLQIIREPNVDYRPHIWACSPADSDTTGTGYLNSRRWTFPQPATTLPWHISSLQYLDVSARSPSDTPSCLFGLFIMEITRVGINGFSLDKLGFAMSQAK